MQIILVVPEQPNSSTSEPEMGMLQVGSDNEGEPPVEPSNQYSRYILSIYVVNHLN